MKKSRCSRCKNANNLIFQTLRPRFARTTMKTSNAKKSWISWRAKSTARGRHGHLNSRIENQLLPKNTNSKIRKTYHKIPTKTTITKDNRLTSQKNRIMKWNHFLPTMNPSRVWKVQVILSSASLRSWSRDSFSHNLSSHPQDTPKWAWGWLGMRRLSLPRNASHAWSSILTTWAACLSWAAFWAHSQRGRLWIRPRKSKK